MNAYLQILSAKAWKVYDTSISDITQKAIWQEGRMNTVVSGFLYPVRFGDSKIKLNCKVFNIAMVVKQIESESLTTVITHRMIFRWVDFTPVNADIEKLEQVVFNLINNAVKHSPENCIINVAYVTKGTIADISVKDYVAVGIVVKDQPHLFDRFCRMENEELGAIKGFGIGLYICKIIELYGGQIGVDSEAGKGS